MQGHDQITFRERSDFSRSLLHLDVKFLLAAYNYLHLHRRRSLRVHICPVSLEKFPSLVYQEKSSKFRSRQKKSEKSKYLEDKFDSDLLINKAFASDK
jgi:hypothetical protein